METATTSISATAPGQIRVIKRNGSVVEFDGGYIKNAVVKAYCDPKVYGANAAGMQKVNEMSDEIATAVEKVFKSRMPSGGTITIEEIQDQVELQLMRMGEQLCAREYVLYRQRHADIRENSNAERRHLSRVEGEEQIVFKVKMDPASDEITEIAASTIHDALFSICDKHEGTSANEIMDEVLKNTFNGMAYDDLWQAVLMSTQTQIEVEPNYSYVAAGICLKRVYDSVEVFLNCNLDNNLDILQKSLDKGIELEMLDIDISAFDLDQLADAIQIQRDKQFKYLGIQILIDRYLLKDSEENIFETPQIFFMRVAMGLCTNEDNKTKSAIEFYELFSSFDYMPSTPTLFNSGSKRSQLSSCYLTTVPDDLKGIYAAISDNALLSKWAGGLGNDWTNVRGLGSYIKGTNGKSQGVVPFLKVANDTAVAVNQGGKRKGAVCSYLETWHIDIEEFLELRKNTGDDRRRTHDMNTANWIPDLFMKRVALDEEWTLFTPSECPDLHDLYGKAFEERYAYYEKEAEAGRIKSFKKIDAVTLWKKMVGMVFETGHPWMTWKDPCNIRSPQQHVGVVHSSNLCTEITLNTSEDEIAVCNLGSINLTAHLHEDGSINEEKIEKTVKTAVRMLDNVIDINYYAVPQAELSNLKHRPVGLGLMGFQDCLHIKKIPYTSEKAVTFADESMELISYYAIKASAELAQERGSYPTFEGSLWSEGILPIDSIDLLKEHRGSDYLLMNNSSTLDWAALRQEVKKGMRNSNVMAIAPTATIANIIGVSQSIEPTYENLYVKSNLSGEFTVVNEYLASELKKRGLWDVAMVNDLKFNDGRVQKIERIPEELRMLFSSAFEIDPKWLIECAARRQKWIDQAQSLNLYIQGTDGKKLDRMYRMAWQLGLKTTYYLRALGATSTEKSTINTGVLNAVSSGSDVSGPAPVPSACSLDDPDCEACQ